MVYPANILPCGCLARYKMYIVKRTGHVVIMCLTDTVWNTWGPIDHTAIIMYGWSDELVALLANYGSILYIVAFIPMVWLLGRSLRLAMIVTSGFMALGTALRYYVHQDDYQDDNQDDH